MTRNTEKKLAKIIVDTMWAITFAAFITLIVVVIGMVEAWEITTMPVIICVACVVWLVGITVFIRWAER